VDGKTCAWCNKETAMAAFGIALGLMFIAMSVDLLRRGRMSTVDSEGVSNDED
jgi:hypothetical protein